MTAIWPAGPAEGLQGDGEPGLGGLAQRDDVDSFTSGRGESRRWVTSAPPDPGPGCGRTTHGGRRRPAWSGPALSSSSWVKRQSAEHDIEPGSLLRVVSVVLEIRLVHEWLRSATGPGRARSCLRKMVSKVQSRPLCPYCTPRMSKGVASRGTSSGFRPPNRNSASSSTKRLDQPGETRRGRCGRRPGSSHLTTPPARSSPSSTGPARRPAPRRARAPSAGSGSRRQDGAQLAPHALPGRSAVRPLQWGRPPGGRSPGRASSAYSAARAAARTAHQMSLVGGRDSVSLRRRSAVPPASRTWSATHSSCSRVRASWGRATTPSASWATPSPRSRRQMAIRGAEGSLRDPVHQDNPAQSARV